MYEVFFRDWNEPIIEEGQCQHAHRYCAPREEDGILFHYCYDCGEELGRCCGTNCPRW